MATYNYYTGPWRWVDDDSMPHYAPPVGAVGALDLSPVPSQGIGGEDRGGCLCWTDAPLDSAYVLLATGDCREIASTNLMRSKFQSELGVAVEGDSLVDLIYDTLIGGADPTGENGPKPLMPTVARNLELWMPGHSRTKVERFVWGTHRATDKIKSMIRAEFDGLKKDAESGKMRDDKQHLRVLDYWCEKYRVADWKEFVDPKSHKNVPGRVKHETTITDDFNRANQTGLGTSAGGWSWTSATGSINIASNAAAGSATTHSACRAESDLSSADHYAQADRTASSGAIGYFSPVARFAPSAFTYYAIFQRSNGTDAGLFKRVGGAFTSLTTRSGSDAACTLKCEANGSTIKGYVDGSNTDTATDTAITGNIRAGVTARLTGDTGDDFEAADLAAPPATNRRRRLIMGAAT